METNQSNRAGRWAIGLGLILALAIGGLAGSIVTARSGHLSTIHATTIPLQISTGVPVATGEVSFANGFSAVVHKVVPAVVNISASKIVAGPAQSGRMNPFAEPFHRFFGDEFQPPRGERRERGLGSGVIINPEGYILTNNHVVGGASDITITLHDQREFRARIVGTDPKTDLAVIKADVRGLPTAVLGDSGKVTVGEFALAIGSPFGLSQTVTMGIISAKGRVNLGIEDYEDFIQTDTAINPGNSGGALVNSRGELVGINTAIVTGTSGNQGVGFAIPINMAREVMAQILKHGKVIRGYLGAWIQPVTPAIAEAFNLPNASGALLGDVADGSPAARSGLQRGDVIVAINGEPVTDSQLLRMKIAMTPPGTKVALKVRRGNAHRNVDVALGELPVQEEAAPELQGRSERPHSMDGLSVENLTPAIAQQLELPSGMKGVLVTDVESGSAVEEAGLQRGDIVLEVNRKPVVNIAEFRRATSHVSGPTVLLVNREGNTMYVVVK